jgi:hypothetical protein
MKTQKQKVIAFAKQHNACYGGLRAFRVARGSVRQIFQRWFDQRFNGACCGPEEQRWKYLCWLMNVADVRFHSHNWLNRLIKKVTK